ncbi:hypothetical protein [Sandaracinus amylolyticus]|uniref:hypothetical protein n=1 Tax=Sandaracinus amylolyticus TaxID=927083 RepID=UPI001F43BF52|nr:hypothetical protein [Sandaracinus amylolyticus]UJR86877.1 Hypothetical protein I5071_89780 [Sandaracinus amylolyticus]
MRTMLASLGVLAVLIAVPLAAFADAWTTTGLITDYQDGGNGAEIIIAGSTNGEGATCANGSSYVVPFSTLTDAQRARYSQALLAAHLAGRPVRVRVSSTCSAGGYRQYYAVRID